MPADPVQKSAAGAESAPGRDRVRDVLARGCMSRSAFEMLTGRWSALVLIALTEKDYRFNELRRRVDGVSERMLSRALHNLERGGMVSRDVITAIPPRVQYSLTPLGAQIARQFRALADVLEDTAGQVREARDRYDATESGRAGG
jgi:DNA-binding HxlR family transcriptional regulator